VALGVAARLTSRILDKKFLAPAREAGCATNVTGTVTLLP
jgi:hypothetical protein